MWSLADFPVRFVTQCMMLYPQDAALQQALVQRESELEYERVRAARERRRQGAADEPARAATVRDDGASASAVAPATFAVFH